MLKALGLSDEQVNGSQKEVAIEALRGLTPRHMMQELGTSWGRGLYEDFWLDVWKFEHAKSGRAHVVADDVRFANEARLIQSLGGEVWRIDRPGVVTTTQRSSHASEQIDLVPVNRVIINDGSLDKLGRVARSTLMTAISPAAHQLSA